MKKFLLFIGGFIAGVLATIFFAFIYAYASEESESELQGLTFSKATGDCIPVKGLKIFQVIKPNIALASDGEFPNEITVLLLNNENKFYYDNQQIEITSGKCVRQIGNYEYITMGKVPRNVPVVEIE